MNYKLFFLLLVIFFTILRLIRKKLEMNHKKEFAELVNRYKDVIFKVCYVYASREELEDYYQEVLIQLWRSLPNFRNESKMSTWIYRVSLNTCISYVRKNKKVNKVSLIDLDFIDNDIEKKYYIDELYLLINRLNKFEKAIILLWLEERDYEEIASIVGISKNNVAVKLNRIKEKLRKMSNQ